MSLHCGEPPCRALHSLCAMTVADVACSCCNCGRGHFRRLFPRRTKSIRSSPQKPKVELRFRSDDFYSEQGSRPEARKPFIFGIKGALACSLLQSPLIVRAESQIPNLGSCTSEVHPSSHLSLKHKATIVSRNKRGEENSTDSVSWKQAPRT